MSNVKRMGQMIPWVGMKPDYVIERINRIRGRVQQDEAVNSDITSVMMELIERINAMFNNLEKNYRLSFNMDDTRDDKWYIRSEYPFNFSLGTHHAFGNEIQVVMHCSVHFQNERTKDVRVVPFQMVVKR